MQGDAPTWEPLLDLAPNCIDEFMWMFKVELEDGVRLHAYKHRLTRRYIHLTEDGRAFYYREPSSYREIDPHKLLGLVLA